MGIAEFAGGLSRLAPGLDERSVRRQLDDAVVSAAAVTVRHVDAAVRPHQDVGGLVEDAVPFARDSGNAQAHQQLPVLAELVYLVADTNAAPGVRHPDVVLRVHEDAVGPDEHAGAEALQQVAVAVEEQDRRHLFLADTGVLAASLRHPDVPAAVLGREDRARGTPGPVTAQLAPYAFYLGVGIRRVVLGQGGAVHLGNRNTQGRKHNPPDPGRNAHEYPRFS